jgi:cold shock protein
MVVGVVREWHDDEGWGVLDSDETPGGCWAHFSALSMAGYRQAVPGQSVTFTYQQSSQDGFVFVALDVTIDGVPRVEPESQPPGPGFMSRLTVEADTDPGSGDG